jgi:hypothetical protein
MATKQLKTLQDTYKVVFGKPPSNKYKNDASYLEGRLTTAGKQVKTDSTPDKQLRNDVKSLLKKQVDAQKQQKQQEKNLKQLLNSNLTSEELEKQQLHREYVALFQKRVPAPFVNRLSWIKQKIEEKRNESLASSVVSKLEAKRKLEEEASESSPVKKQKTELAFHDLMNKATSYKEWIQYNKLKENATDDDKKMFVKKAEGNTKGKESWYSLKKMEERIEESQLKEIESLKNVKGLFANTQFRKKITDVLKILDNLHKDETDKFGIDKGIHIDFLPLVFESLANHLNDKAIHYKNQLVHAKIDSFVTEFNENAQQSETEMLKQEIEELKSEIALLPLTKRTASLRGGMKDELREKELRLLTLETGSQDAQALDLMNGASQMY